MSATPPRAAAAAASAPASAPAKRQMPGWMSIPGGPPEPNGAAFRAKMTRLVEERRVLVAEVKELRATLGPREGQEAVEAELSELRQRMGDIDTQRKLEQEMRFKKNEEIQRVQKIHDERLSKLHELSDGLGGFKTLKEIDEAIAYLTRKMETSGGGLGAEKRTVRQLSKLEEAKRYLLEMQPLTEAINEAKHREALLQREWQEINERVRNLKSEYNEQRMTKQQKEQELRKTGVNRQEVYKKCDEISAKIKSLSDEMNTLREEHNKAVEAWNAWREEARAKYAAKIEAERKERQRRYLEFKNAAKMEEKRARALRRQNPYEAEADACSTLIQYLRDKKTMVQREEAELARQEAAATFDPTKFLPEGAVLLNDGKKRTDANKGAGLGKKNKQQQQQQQQKPKANTTKNRVLQHSEDKIRLFQLIGEEPPLALASIDAAMERIRVKQQEYESHKKTGELELSSDDDEEEEEEEKVEQQEEEEQKEEQHQDEEEQGEKEE